MHATKIINKSDHDLLAESFTELVRKNPSLIKRAASKAANWITAGARQYKSLYDVDDCIQEGLAHAWLGYKTYTQSAIQSGSMRPELWLYYTILSGAGKYSSKLLRKKVTFITTAKSDSVGLGDYSEYNITEEALYDFDKEEDLALMSKNIVGLPEKERSLLISFLNCGCLANRTFREMKIQNNFNNLSDLHHSLELLKLKILFGKDEALLSKIRNYSLSLAIDYAINNSKKSLSCVPMKTDRNGHTYGTNKYNVFKSCFEVVKTIARYTSLADKKIIDITPEDCDIILEKLELSDYSEAGLTKINYRRRLRFIMDRLVNMGVINQNPVAFRMQYGLKKIQGALSGKTARGKEKKGITIVDKHADVYYPLVQKTFAGEFIRYYKTIAELKVNGFSYSNIQSQMSGRTSHAYGCYWEYANPNDAAAYLREHDTDHDYAEMIRNEKVDFNKDAIVVRCDLRYDRKGKMYKGVTLDENNKIIRLRPDRKIFQFAYSGEFVREFANIREAVSAGYNESSLKTSIDRKPYHQYLWSHNEDFATTIFAGWKPKKDWQFKKIEKLDAKGKVVATYLSIKSAESETVRIPTLNLALKKHKTTGKPGYYAGFYWRYAGEDFQVQTVSRKYNTKAYEAAGYEWIEGKGWELKNKPVQVTELDGNNSERYNKLMSEIKELERKNTEFVNNWAKKYSA